MVVKAMNASPAQKQELDNTGVRAQSSYNGTMMIVKSYKAIVAS